jgi:hypothetical protein
MTDPQSIKPPKNNHKAAIFRGSGSPYWGFLGVSESNTLPRVQITSINLPVGKALVRAD